LISCSRSELLCGENGGSIIAAGSKIRDQRDAVMGAREPVRDPNPHEIGIVADVIAPDEDTSRAIMAKARYALLHTDFRGRKSISGNLAIPFSSDLPAGETYRFSVWHTLDVDDPLAPFPMEMIEVGPRHRSTS
jgi:hypothetical protein